MITEPQINLWGEVIPSVSKWSNPIPCEVSTVSENLSAKSADALRSQSSYDILAEYGCAMDIRRVKVARYGINLGEFAVRSIEPFGGVGRIRIKI